MFSSLDDSDYCLDRARELRIRAQTMQNRVARLRLWQLSRDYLRLATRANKRRQRVRADLAS